MESRLAASATRTAAALSEELDKRLGAAYEALELQLRALGGQIDKLECDKADTAALGRYAAQVGRCWRWGTASRGCRVQGPRPQQLRADSGLALS